MNIALIESVAQAYLQGAAETDIARLEFFTGLYKLQQARAETLNGAAGYELPDRDQVESWYWSNTPVLAQAPLLVDASQFCDTLAMVADYLRDNAGFDDAAASALGIYNWAGFASNADLAQAGRDPSAFIDTCLSHIDSFGVSPDLPANVFMMVPLFALRPHLQGAAEAIMGTVDTVEGRRTHDNPVNCPVCGSPAAASLVGESAGTDGKGRLQYCSFCGTQWPYERIRCGKCGEMAPSKLHYFHVEGDPAHRLQNCDACGQYQRVVFQEDLGALTPCMEVEDVVMAKLDRIALDPRFRQET